MSRMFMEVAGQILNVDMIVCSSPTEIRQPNGLTRSGTRVELHGRSTPLMLDVEFAEFRRLLDRLLNLHVTEGETVHHDHRAR